MAATAKVTKLGPTNVVRVKVRSFIIIGAVVALPTVLATKVMERNIRNSHHDTISTATSRVAAQPIRGSKRTY